jgi:adenine-specific DNA-methyltransferase
VIGNPPYIKVQNIEKKQINYFKSKFESANGKYDLYVLFIENSLTSLIRHTGQVTFINPHRFMIAEYGAGLRRYLLKEKFIKKILTFGVEQVFETATTYTGVFFFSKNLKSISYCNAVDTKLNNLIFNAYEYSDIEDGVWHFKDKSNSDLIKKLTKHRLSSNVFLGVFQGLIPMGDEVQILEGKISDDKFIGYSKALMKSVILEAALMKPLLKGENIQRYRSPESSLYAFYPHIKNVSGKTVPIDESELKLNFPLGYNYIVNFKNELKDKKIKYKTNPIYWYSLHRSREMSLFESEKLITPQLQNKPSFTFDQNSFYPDAGGYMVIKKTEDLTNIKAYLAIFNSKLFYYFITQTSTPYNNNYYYFKTNYIEPFSIPLLSKELEEFLVFKVEQIIIDKQHGKNTLVYEHEIDLMIYSLYDLSEEEISIVEQS